MIPGKGIRENAMKAWMVSLGAAILSLSSGFAAAQTATDVVCTSCVGRADIANGAVDTSKLATSAVRTPDIANSAVTGEKIKNGSVALADFATPLKDALGPLVSDITFQGVEAFDPGVASVECPENTVAISASCVCDDVNGTRNFGVLFGCAVDGVGAAAGCFPEAQSFNPTKPDPRAQVLAVCMEADTFDGSPWQPASAGAPPAAGSLKARATAAEREAWTKLQRDKYEALVRGMKEKLARYEEARR
jgi:hypothetical protein